MTNHFKGVLLAVITAVMWEIIGLFLRELSAIDMSNVEISFCRSIWNWNFMHYNCM